MSKALVALVACGVATLSLSPAVFATTTDSPTQILQTYLQAAQQSDTSQMVALVDNQDPEVQSMGLNEYFSRAFASSGALTGYKILSETSQQDGSELFSTDLTYQDGEVQQVPFRLVNQSGDWKVLFSPHALTSSNVKIVTPPKVSIQPMASVLTSWPNSTNYPASHTVTDVGGSTFDITATTGYVTMNIQQRAVLQSNTAALTYQVVQPGLSSPYYWGQRYVSGNIWGTPQQLQISGQGAMSGMQLWIWNDQTFADEGFGELYNN